MDMRGQLLRRTTGLADLIESKPRALRVSDVAAILNVSERQVYKLSAEHLLPSFRVGASLRFCPKQTAAWLRQKMSVAAIEITNPARRRA